MIKTEIKDGDGEDEDQNGSQDEEGQNESDKDQDDSEYEDKETGIMKTKIRMEVKLLRELGREFQKRIADAVKEEEYRKSTFFRDVCEMMVGANIPFHKVENVFFKNFIEKYTEKQLPSESTLRKNYLPDCYADVLNQIMKAVGNNKISVSVDETTDETRRFVAHVVVGTLSPDGPGEKFLLTAETEVTFQGDLTVPPLRKRGWNEFMLTLKSVTYVCAATQVSKIRALDIESGKQPLTPARSRRRD
ncbi:hypothetical protein ANN_01488 [Periplaneta americana]|uniref:Uncharacterized protein n=1 Tax=Periplaneta americana TaxID=6978 RepID=A0ABQ8TVC6_PERAM|nr:hypothetical protein ANN_01488 [Periplaneta americana]